MIKLLLLRHGEEIISTVQEIVDPETEKPLGYRLHKPFRLDIVDQSQGQGYQLEWFPWAPLSKDKDFFIPGNHVVTVYEPLDALTTQYISAIDEERYEANFKKHEERFNLSYEEQDLDAMFSEAQKIMNEDDGNTTPPTEDRNIPDN
tara:strand:+ start:68 stop:508 length:441 start_codon:yes stop_codon:yes gene_type:complete